MKLDRLCISQLRETNPDRFQKIDLGTARIRDLDGSTFVVERDDDDADAHPVELSRQFNHYWGSCECDGYRYHDGPCSHLAAVFRAAGHDILEVPQLDVQAVFGSPRDERQARLEATGQTEPEIVPDGGSI